MGWTTTNRYGEPVKDFIVKRVLTWSSDTKAKYTVLDTALVKMKTFYAAVERIDGETGERMVWAAVILVDYGPWKHDSNDFGWKDMDETCGPCESECPERILNLLTPTENQYANDWRARCRQTIARRKTVGEVGEGYAFTLYGKRYIITGKTGPSWTAVGPDGRTYKVTRANMVKAEDIAPPPAMKIVVQPIAVLQQVNLF